MNNIISKCIEETGRELILNNQDIVKYLCSIEEERNTLELIIQKQYQERKRIEAEIEKLTYKLCLINKSLSMRIKAKNNYDKTVDEIRAHYEKLVNSSTTLKKIVEKTQQELDDIMNKKTGTGSGPNGEEITMLYVKSEDRGPEECPCVYINELPTKEYQSHTNTKPSTPPRQLSEESQDNDYKENFDSRPDNSPHNNDETTEPESNTWRQSGQIPNGNLSNNQTKTGSSEEEVEINTFPLEKERSKRQQPRTGRDSSSDPNLNGSDKFTRSTDISIQSVERSNEPLHDIVVRPNSTEDQSTNLLISRLRRSLNQMSETAYVKPRPESKLVQPSEESKSTHSGITSLTAESESIIIRKGKMEKRSVTEVLQAPK